MGRRIKKLRKGVSMEKLAREADISLGYWARIEAGKQTPSLDVLRKIARVLGVKPADLL